jgi:hypothetical protein
MEFRLFTGTIGQNSPTRGLVEIIQEIRLDFNCAKAARPGDWSGGAQS